MQTFLSPQSMVRIFWWWAVQFAVHAAPYLYRWLGLRFDRICVES